MEHKIKIGDKVYTPIGLAGVITELDLARGQDRIVSDNRWVVEIVGPNSHSYNPVCFFEAELTPISDELYEAMKQLNVRVVGYFLNYTWGYSRVAGYIKPDFYKVEAQNPATGEFSVWEGKYNTQTDALDTIVKEYQNRR